MGHQAADRAERRQLRQTFGASLTTTADKVRAIESRVGGLYLLLGTPDEMSANATIYERLGVLEAALLNLAEARRLQLEREQARDRSLWTRMRWLLTGTTKSR